MAERSSKGEPAEVIPFPTPPPSGEGDERSESRRVTQLEPRHHLWLEREIPVPIDWAWREEGLCRNKNISPSLNWFPEKHKKANAEKNVCAVCPVQAECMTYSVVTWQPWGVWGGYNDRERREIKKLWRRQGLLLSKQGEHQVRFDDVEEDDDDCEECREAS